MKHKIIYILKRVGSYGLILGILIMLLGIYGVYDTLHPPRSVPPGYTLVEQNISFQHVDLYTEDGLRLTGWYTPPKNGVVILLAHGYGDNRPEWIHAMLAKKGFGVLAWDARAHGESGGEISTLGYKEVLDVKAALNFALAQPGVLQIGGWGGSMGGATMIRAAAELPQIQAVVVDSSFSSLGEEVDFLAPYPLINPLAKLLLQIRLGVNFEETSPATLIGKISPRPVYIIQGTDDTVASPGSGEALYNAASDPRYLWVEENAIHLGIYLNNPGRYQRRVANFFDEYLLNKWRRTVCPFASTIIDLRPPLQISGRKHQGNHGFLSIGVIQLGDTAHALLCRWDRDDHKTCVRGPQKFIRYIEGFGAKDGSVCDAIRRRAYQLQGGSHYKIIQPTLISINKIQLTIRPKVGSTGQIEILSNII